MTSKDINIKSLQNINDQSTTSIEKNLKNDRNLFINDTISDIPQENLIVCTKTVDNTPRMLNKSTPTLIKKPLIYGNCIKNSLNCLIKRNFSSQNLDQIPDFFSGATSKSELQSLVLKGLDNEENNKE